MGKGDIKTKKGKIAAKSFGVSRPRKPSNTTNNEKPAAKSGKSTKKKSTEKAKK